MMSARTIVVLGLDNSHPYVDVENLRALDPRLRFVLVSGEAGDREARFLRENPDASVTADLGTAVATSPAGILVTLRPSRLLAELPALVRARRPAFVNKPGLVTWRQLDAALPVLHEGEHRLMTASVLRYAPAVQNIVLDRNALRSARVFVGHGIDHWKQPGNEWQGDIGEGGGVVGALGYHALELLDELFGPGFTVNDVAVAGREPSELPGGDRAVIIGHWPDGVSGTIELDTRISGEQYEVRWTTIDGESAATIDASVGDGFGYRAAMAAFLRHMDGHAAPAWPRSEAILRTAASAHALSAT